MRLLLDQNFPNPGWFDPSALMGGLRVEHLSSFNPSLAEEETPDWLIYLHAHHAGFNAVVTRDLNQTTQPEEMWALTRTNLSLITWRSAIEDPIVEWGQIVAFLPQVARILAEKGPAILLLPKPMLRSGDSVKKATEYLAEAAAQRGVSAAQVRREAKTTIEEWLADRGQAHMLL